MYILLFISFCEDLRFEARGQECFFNTFLHLRVTSNFRKATKRDKNCHKFITHLKFKYSEKATVIWPILHSFFENCLVALDLKWKMGQMFLAFIEY